MFSGLKGQFGGAMNTNPIRIVREESRTQQGLASSKVTQKGTERASHKFSTAQTAYIGELNRYSLVLLIILGPTPKLRKFN